MSSPPVDRLQRFELAIAPLLGGLATLGFAPFDFWPASPLALAALFLLCAGRPARRATLLGWLFGFAHFATGVYWVFISTHVYGGAAAWLGLLLASVLFSYMALYPALACGVTARLDAWRRPAGFALLPALWLLGELLRGWVYSGFPWLSLGYIALDSPAERFAPLIGVHGLSAIYVLCATALFRAFDARGKLRIASIAIALLPVTGVLLPAGGTWTHDDGAAMNVAIVQGNFSQDQKWQSGMTEEILDRYHAMTQAALDAKLVAWPEAVPNQPYDLVPDFFDTLDKEAAERGATLLAGVLIRDDDETIYNSMLAVGASHGRYDKRHLVPFGEYFPIPDWLRPIMDVLGTPYSDFSSGGGRYPPIVVDGHRIGLSICFEDVFGGEFAKEYRDASLLVNSTNDAWFARSSAPHQHLQIARFRALETGRWIVRATNTGVSAFIAPDGRTTSRSSLFETQILRGQVVPRAGLTPYMRWTNVPLWIGSILVVLACVVLRVAQRRKMNVS